MVELASFVAQGITVSSPTSAPLRIAATSSDDRPDGAVGQVTEFEQELVNHFEDLAALLGVPRSYGAVYGILFASPRSLSFTDIQEKLTLSKGSISQGLRALREVGAIKPADGDDPRREHFLPETELRMLIRGFVEETIQPQLKTGLLRIDGMKSRYRASLTARSGEGRLLQGRIDKLQAWHRRSGRLLPLISKFLG